jgi:CRISPR-associated endonuclease Cas1
VAKGRGRVAPAVSTLVEDVSVLVLDGFGVHVGVERGHLVTEDGIADDRRRLRLHKATAGLWRLVILGTGGTVTLAALRWLNDARAALVVIAPDGTVIHATGPSRLDHARLRRAQALAAGTAWGLDVARWLVGRKLEGQAANLAHVDRGRAGDVVLSIRGELDGTADPRTVRDLEAAAADVYWAALADLPVSFPARVAVPDHWRVLGARISPLGHASPNRAITPGHALLNYLYAALETEAVIACHALGLDPGVGILHVDVRHRDGLALDLMEAVRPAVDTYVLDLMAGRALDPREFGEQRDGGCRLAVGMTRALAPLTHRWRLLVGAVAEEAAQRLLDQGGAGWGRVPTRLTHARNRRLPMRLPEPPMLPAACRECGTPLTKADRVLCDACATRSWERAVEASRKVGRRASIGGKAGLKRARAASNRYRLNREWERVGGVAGDVATFRAEVLPGLAAVPLSVMARATGLSTSHCAAIRRGASLPHPRHWEVLRGLITG